MLQFCEIYVYVTALRSGEMLHTQYATWSLKCCESEVCNMQVCQRFDDNVTEQNKGY